MEPIIHVPIHVAMKIVRELLRSEDTKHLPTQYILDLINAIAKHSYVYQGNGRFTKPI